MFFYPKINLNKLKCSFTLLLFFLLSIHSQAQFSKITGANGLNNNSVGVQNNGHAWGDVDNDGDLDVIMHVGNGGNSTLGKLFLNSGSPSYTFTDATATKIAGFNDGDNFGRQMLIVDFNNDGYNDILRGFGGSRDIEIYYNDGPPNYTFGDGSQQPDVLIGAPPTGEHNTEGVAAIDWNQDGWLDIIVDNDGGGNDIFENDQTGGFVYQTPGTGSGQTGFADSHAGDGDYMTVADINNDGYVDLYGRKTAVNNYWPFNPATGRFEAQAAPNIVSSEGDKGGTMFCDFDNDGDLDLFWTSFGTNQIWRNDGDNNWTATGIPGTPISTQTAIDGCDCGDYDNDGDLDIILGASSGNSYLLENTTTGGTLSFSSSNLATSADTESATFTDFDNDGDLDIYFVVSGGENQLWENTTNNSNYLYVNALFNNGASARDAIGANVFLTTCDGDTTGLRQVNGGKGHGSQHQKKVHFGLDPNVEYIVEVHYVYDSTLGERRVVKKAIVPSNLTNQEITIINTNTSEVFFCQDTDGDGAKDYRDLDDDNDGILDIDECGVVNRVNPNDLGYTTSDTAPFDITNEDISSLFSLPAGSVILNATNVSVNPSNANQWNHADGDPIPSFNFSGTIDVLETRINHGAQLQGLGERDGIISNDGNTYDFVSVLDADYTEGNVGTDYYIEHDGSGTPGGESNAGGLRWVSTSHPIKSFSVYSTNQAAVSAFFFDIRVPCDTDGDNVFDYQDLDSDDDGCPDALEGDGGFTFADIENDTLTGGVDANGIPITATSSGQAVGTSANSAQIADECDSCNSNSTLFTDNDNDGIADLCDLDDDNDGIPDSEELSCLSSGAFEWDNSTTNGDLIGNFTSTNGISGTVTTNYTYTPSVGYPNYGDNAAYIDFGRNAGVKNSVGTISTIDIPDGFIGGEVIFHNIGSNSGFDDSQIVKFYYKGVEVSIIPTIAHGGSFEPITGLIQGVGFNPSPQAQYTFTIDQPIDKITTTSAAPTSAGEAYWGMRILNNNFCSIDFDGDGIANHLDLDSDNDGIPDFVEAGGVDTNGDGQVDYPTPTDPTSMVDLDGDGLADTYDNTDSQGSTPSWVSGTSIENTDSDGDGLVDALDLDADNDGIPDIVEAGGVDSNGDGLVDDLNPDGTLGTDNDNDGFADNFDPDDDDTPGVDSGEGDQPLVETNGSGQLLNGETGASLDSDGDGLPDHIDLDADNDGIPDIVEAGGVDSNGDGLVDNTTDADNDGYADIFDTDDDGTAGVEDANDALLQTGGTDTDGDGKADDAAIVYENGESVNADTDGDGLPDHIDLDADNDGIPDIVEAGGVDSNGDGLVDNTTDADNDGYADIFDTDDDGTAGVEDTNDALLQTGGTDTDGDGKADDAAIVYQNGESVNADTDGDGLPDHLDLDADNDGIPDLVEAGGIDSNGDGLVDVVTDVDNDGFADIFDADNDGTAGIDDATLALIKTGGTDTDGDGKADDAAITYVDGDDNSADTDSDGYPDYLDLDADNDGIPDILEAGGVTPNNDGMVNILAAPWDSDNDGLADIYDENNSGTALVETTADTNSDGKVNATESMSPGGSNIVNADGDGYPNHLDLDADNDGITDVVENAGGVVTADNTSGTLDGIVGDNPNVTDSDSDGWHDPSTTSITDTDGDGIADYLDIDADNDGIVDYLEGVCSTCPTFTLNPAANPTDANGNGVLDIYESLNSSNGSGGSNIGASPNVDDDSANSTPDYLDTDTDSDGANDWTEGYDANDNGRADDDLMTMATSYETATSNGYYVNATDTDADGIPDWLDNQPSVAGYDETSRPPFLNQATAFWHDDDNDGLVDLLDVSQSGTAAPTPDNNGGNDLDWRDMTALVVLPVELSSFSAKERDCKIVLNWETKSEEDFDYFELQWSGDGHEFVRLNSILNNGNSNGGNYKSIDENPSTNNYYRLKMVDLNGEYEYSKVVYVKLNCTELENEVHIFPNPIQPTQELNVEFLSQKNTEQIVLIDMLGRIVKRVTFETEQGINKISLDISNLSAGSYQLQIVGSKASKMIIIQE